MKRDEWGRERGCGVREEKRWDSEDCRDAERGREEKFRWSGVKEVLVKKRGIVT